MSKISFRKEGNILAVVTASPGRELWSWFFLPAILPFSCRSSGLASDKAPPLHSNTTAPRESQLARGGRHAARDTGRETDPDQEKHTSLNLNIWLNFFI